MCPPSLIFWSALQNHFYSSDINDKHKIIIRNRSLILQRLSIISMSRVRIFYLDISFSAAADVEASWIIEDGLTILSNLTPLVLGATRKERL